MNEMKKLILILAFAGIISGSYAQNISSSDVPPAVVKTFTRNNPRVDAAEWTQVGEYYKATFASDKLIKSVTYDATGKLKFSELQVTLSQLPTPVLAYINQNYPGNVVSKSSKITTSKGKNSYFVKIKDSELAFDSQGNYLNSERE
jgi:hypothetical protein